VAIWIAASAFGLLAMTSHGFATGLTEKNFLCVSVVFLFDVARRLPAVRSGPSTNP
jgi:hypothetical protein